LLIASLVAAELTGIWTPVLLVLTIEATVLYRLKERLQQVLFPAERAFDFDGLKTFAGLLLEIERERFDSPPLRSLADGTSSGAARTCPARARCCGPTHSVAESSIEPGNPSTSVLFA
jgi:hypothetical protein